MIFRLNAKLRFAHPFLPKSKYKKATKKLVISSISLMITLFLIFCVLTRHSSSAFERLKRMIRECSQWGLVEKGSEYSKQSVVFTYYLSASQLAAVVLFEPSI